MRSKSQPTLHRHQFEPEKNSTESGTKQGKAATSEGAAAARKESVISRGNVPDGSGDNKKNHDAEPLKDKLDRRGREGERWNDGAGLAAGHLNDDQIQISKTLYAAKFCDDV